MEGIKLSHKKIKELAETLNAKRTNKQLALKVIAYSNNQYNYTIHYLYVDTNKNGIQRYYYY